MSNSITKNPYWPIFQQRTVVAGPKSLVTLGQKVTDTKLFADGQQWQKQGGSVTTGRLSVMEVQTLNALRARIEVEKQRMAKNRQEARNLYEMFKYAVSRARFHKSQSTQLEEAYKTHVQYYIRH